MATSSGSRKVSAAMRVGALGCRAIVVFLIAKYLLPEDLGLFGLVVAVVSFAVYPLGLDFYTYSGRQIIQSERSDWRSHIKSHTALGGLLMLIVLPLVIVVFVSGILPWSVIVWFYIILALEVIAMELERVLVAMSEQFWSSLAIFVRQGLYCFSLVVAFEFVPSSRELTTVLFAWIGFNLCGILVCSFTLIAKLKKYPRGKVDWGWIKEGIRVSIPFLIGTLCVRALFTVDRQLVGTGESLSVLGAYTLYISIGIGIVGVLTGVIHQFFYPQLVEAVHVRNLARFREGIWQVFLQTIGVLLTIIISTLAALPYFLRWVGDPIYSDYAWLLPVVLVIFSIYGISLVAHSGLYAMHRDRAILWSTVGAFAVFVITFVAMRHVGVVSAVLGAVGAASLTLLLVKSLVLYRSFSVSRSQWDDTAKAPPEMLK